MSSQVLIAGCGPVGLCLAIDLAMRGISVTIVETRPPREVPTVRCNHVASRTMEAFRRMGIASQVREAGLPDAFPNDIVFRPVATRDEFARIPIPGRQDRVSGQEGPDSWWPTPEPPHRCNQIFFEPLLFDRAAEFDKITILNRTRVDGFRQDEAGVTVSITDLDIGTASELSADDLVGCDGGRSLVRKEIGARLRGDAEIQKVQSTYFRAPLLLDRIPGKPRVGIRPMAGGGGIRVASGRPERSPARGARSAAGTRSPRRRARRRLGTGGRRRDHGRGTLAPVAGTSGIW